MNIDCFGTVTVHVLYYYNLLLSNSEVHVLYRSFKVAEINFLY